MFIFQVLSRILTIISKLTNVKKTLLTQRAFAKINSIFDLIGQRFDESIRSYVEINGNTIAFCLKKAKWSSFSFATRKSGRENITIYRGREIEDGSYIKIPAKRSEEHTSELQSDVCSSDLLAGILM